MELLLEFLKEKITFRQICFRFVNMDEALWEETFQNSTDPQNRVRLRNFEFL